MSTILLLQLTAPDLSAGYNWDMIKMGLQFKLGWALGLSVWAFVLNFSIGLFNNTLKELAEKRILPGGKVEAIFGSFWYRLIVYIVDKATRFKLPTQASKTPTEPKP